MVKIEPFMPLRLTYNVAGLVSANFIFFHRSSRTAPISQSAILESSCQWIVSCCSLRTILLMPSKRACSLIWAMRNSRSTGSVGVPNRSMSSSVISSSCSFDLICNNRWYTEILRALSLIYASSIKASTSKSMAGSMETSRSTSLC